MRRFPCFHCLNAEFEDRVPNVTFFAERDSTFTKISIFSDIIAHNFQNECDMFEEVRAT